MTTSYAPTFSRLSQNPVTRWFWTVDRQLLAAALALVALGVALSFASSPAAIRADQSITDPFHYAWRMIVFASAGVVAMLSLSMMTPRWIRRMAILALLGSMVVMALLPFIGDEVKGAARWINLGPFSLQPSEFAKPGLIVLAAWMFAESQKGEGVPGILIAFSFWIVTVALLLLQPDIGQTLLVTTTFVAVFFMAGVPWKWLGAMAAAGAGGLATIYLTFGHVRDRLSRFGSEDAGATYQIDRASEAIRAGGLVGRGVGEGVMKTNVPDLHTDFIYSVGAEEFGLMLSLAMIALYAFIVLHGMRRAMKLNDPFEQTAAAGLFILIGLQACINIAVNLALIPTKGMTLPFVSYGGSSMLAMGLTMGMALGLTRRRPGAYELGANLPEGRRIIPTGRD